MKRAPLLAAWFTALIGLALSAWAGHSAAAAPSSPVVPTLDGKVRTRTLATMRRGERLGNRANVFAKIGDSLSQSAAFAQGMGCGRWRPGAHRALRSTVRLFAARTLPGTSTYCARVNSFSRDSLATSAGKIAGWALEPGDPGSAPCGARAPLLCEIRITRPAFALILFGTNDVALAPAVGGDPLPGFLTSMTRIIATSRARGVVPVLSTIPPRLDDPAAEPLVEELNHGLVRLAANRGVPLINLWRALAPLPGSGISADGIHLSVFDGPQCIRVCNPNSCAPSCRPADLTGAGLRYGYNVRNLITLTTLARLASLGRSSGHGGRDDG